MSHVEGHGSAANHPPHINYEKHGSWPTPADEPTVSRAIAVRVLLDGIMERSEAVRPETVSYRTLRPEDTPGAQQNTFPPLEQGEQL